MKTIFKEITAVLDALPSLRWVDEDKGQMNFERPPILFPAALVSLGNPRINTLSDTMEECTLLVTVKLCFDFAGNTNSLTPEQSRDQSLAYYDILEEVENALQGYAGTEFNGLSQQNFVQLPRPDGYKTVSLSFLSSYFRDR